MDSEKRLIDRCVWEIIFTLFMFTKVRCGFKASSAVGVGKLLDEISLPTFVVGRIV